MRSRAQPRPGRNFTPAARYRSSAYRRTTRRRQRAATVFVAVVLAQSLGTIVTAAGAATAPGAPTAPSAGPGNAAGDGEMDRGARERIGRHRVRRHPFCRSDRAAGPHVQFRRDH